MSATPGRNWLNVIIYLGTTVVTSVLGLLTALLMTHLLPPEQFGRIGIFLSVLYLAVPAVSLAAEGLVAVNRATLDDEQYERFRRTMMAIGMSTFLLLEALALVLWAAGFLRDWLLLMVPAFALLRLASTTAATEYIVERKARAYALVTTLNSILAMALTFGLMTWMSASAGARVAALMLAELVVVLVRYRGRMGLLLRPAFDPTYRRQIVTFGMPSLLALAGAWGLNESDKVIVTHGAGLELGGIYTATAALAVITMSFNQSLANALFPALFERLTSRTEAVRSLMFASIAKFLGLNAAFAAIVMLGYFLTKDWLLPVKYAAGSPYFYALVMATLAVALYRPLGLIVDYFKMARLRAVAIIAGGATTIGSATAGVAYSGSPLAAVAGIALGYLVTAAILAIYLYRFRFDDSHYPV